MRDAAPGLEHGSPAAAVGLRGADPALPDLERQAGIHGASFSLNSRDSLPVYSRPQCQRRRTISLVVTRSSHLRVPTEEVYQWLRDNS
jgi:hypothetical protein